jgi:hypothetical protein
MGLTQITTGGVDDNINIDSNTLKVDGTNNRVGIGTATAGRTLSVDGSIQVSNSTSGFGLGEGFEILHESSGSTYLLNRENAETRFYTNNSERMRIDSSGNCGIGTTSPSTKLSVSGGISGTAGANISGGGWGVLPYVANSFVADSTSGQTRLFATGTDASTHGNFLFFTGTTNGTASERMRIDSSGNVGIGLTPTAPLHVGGTIQSQTGSSVAQMYADGGSANFTSVGAYPALFHVNGSERMRIDSSGRLLVGTSSTSATCTSVFAGRSDGATDPVLRLEVNSTSPANGSALGGLNFASSGLSAFQAGARIAAVRDGGTWTNGSSHPTYLEFATTADGASSPTERMRIDSSGQVGIGTSSPAANLHLKSSTSGDPELRIEGSGADNGIITFLGGGHANPAVGLRYISNGDSTGSLAFYANDSSSSTLSERMRIASSGYVEIGNTQDTNSYLLVNTISNQNAVFNRTGTDGTLIIFRHAGTTEGTISVSGNTVSYNGGHLSRWSQLAGGAERTEILRGSVLSNLDEMCEWAYEAQDAVLYTEEDELPEGVSVGDVKTPAIAAGTEDNEQLNRMKVSDVEGDVNVAGVFQAWDDDDDTYTNDFYCAMTGDFVIRIAQGTTVARGDLLMSAGDGTAKPQDDDIVRSKTIAKVTSTTVSTTYSDGSYCVPCVLMAC